jgi:hypothetical protein
MSGTPAPRRNRLAVLGVMAIAVVPLLAAYVLFHSSWSAERWSKTNNGVLLDPPLELTKLGLTGIGADAAIAQRSWHLIVVSDADCATECAAALHQLRQLHILLNKEAPRVQRTLVFLGAVPMERVSKLRAQYPKLGYARGHPGPLHVGVFIADPLGNVVLYYEFGQAGRAILDDLKRLLKVSQIG